MPNTAEQFDSIIQKCRDIFIKKMKDYGSAWRILRTSSITDQIFIKANRIRTIEQKQEQKINEGVDSEYVGMINYSIMGIIQLQLGSNGSEISYEEGVKLFDKYATLAKELMMNKNHDYGEAWRDMRISSLTDLILMKILRIKQIEDNKGTTIISEGIDANYYDILNYSVFALIKLEKVK